MHSTRFPVVSGLRWFAVVVMALMLAAGSLFVVNGGGAVFGASLTISPSSLPAGTVNATYSQTLSANGTSPYSWNITNGSLPSGLSLGSASGTISGTPTASGNSTFTVQVIDSANNTGSESLTLTINPSPSITTSSLPAGEVNGAYSQTLSATGGTGTLSWSTTSGNLSSTGLSMNSSGTISGTPTTAGTFSITATVTDTNGATGTKTLTLTINPAVSVTTTPPLPVGTVNVAYSETLSATGGSGTYTWSIVAGSLPGGLSLGSTSGIISGTPTTSGSPIFSVQATDGITTASTELQIIINPALSVTTSSLPAGTTGVAYSQTLSGTGGATPYTWAVTAGTLPSGLALSGGTISGTPTVSGTSSFTVTLTDSSSPANTATRSLTLTVNAASTGGSSQSSSGAHYSLPAPVTIPLSGNQTGLTLSTRMLAENTVSVSSPDNTVNLTIPTGTLIEVNGKAPSSISLTPVSNAPALPQGESFIGLPMDGQPSGLVFDPAISMVWHIGALPAGVRPLNVRVAYYDTFAKKWINVPATYDAETGDVTATISHFTSYAVYVLEPTPSTTPAAPTATATAPATATPTATAPATPTAPASTTPTVTAPVTPTAPATPTVTAPATPTAPAPTTQINLVGPAPAASSTSSFNWGMLIGVVAAVVIAMSVLLWITGRKRLS